MFRLEKSYFARGAAQPQGIIERRICHALDAVKALRLGEVTVVDRLPPWQVGGAQGGGGHTRVRSLTACRRFIAWYRTHRRGRSCGHPRLSAGAEFTASTGRRSWRSKFSSGKRWPDARSITPFSKGMGLSDPAGYAYNDDIPPRPIEPRLALTLSAVALLQ